MAALLWREGRDRLRARCSGAGVSPSLLFPVRSHWFVGLMLEEREPTPAECARYWRSGMGEAFDWIRMSGEWAAMWIDRYCAITAALWIPLALRTAAVRIEKGRDIAREADLLRDLVTMALSA